VQSNEKGESRWEVKLLDFAHCDEPTEKVGAVRLHDADTMRMDALDAIMSTPTVPVAAITQDNQWVRLYLYLREVGVSEELAQCILKLVRFEVEP
jgi:hypothetical protein